jgi:hypothetical protein
VGDEALGEPGAGRSHRRRKDHPMTDYEKMFREQMEQIAKVFEGAFPKLDHSNGWPGFNGTPIIRGCNIVAYFIMLGGLRRRRPGAEEYDAKITGKEVFSSNSHGELFGVYEAIYMADAELSHLAAFIKKDPESNALKFIIDDCIRMLADDEQIFPTTVIAEVGRNIGKRLCECLWQITWREP